MGRIENLLDEARRFPDPKARSHTQEIVQGLLDLHAVALERILEAVANLGAEGTALIDSMARNDLVGNVFMLYGLHPLDLESRVRLALDDVRPILDSHGGEVELLRVAGGAVRLRMHGASHGCASTARTLKNAIEEAIYNKAPDVTSIDVDGMAETHGEYEGNGRARFALPLV
jgi:Fe-S cluster biogenesis protein NfuA